MSKTISTPEDTIKTLTAIKTVERLFAPHIPTTVDEVRGLEWEIRAQPETTGGDSGQLAEWLEWKFTDLRDQIINTLDTTEK